MAGHSHWANIKHKKSANDARKAKVISQMGRLIKGAIALGGPDPDTNPRLRLAISKAKSQNMTNDNIERILAKARGEGSVGIEELVYEGYGAGGVAIVVETMSDNRNRTAPEIRKLFERGGGSMGAPGCVAWQFRERAVFLVASQDEDCVLSTLLEAEADAEDITVQDEGIEIVAPVESYDLIGRALAKAGLDPLRSDLTRLADNACTVEDLETAQRVVRLIEMLEDHDDVTAVHSNFDPAAAIADQL